MFKLDFFKKKKRSQYVNLHTVLKLSFIQSEKKHFFFFQKVIFLNIRIVNRQLLHIDWREKYLEVNENIKVFLGVVAVAVIPGIKSRLKTSVFKNNLIP